MKEIVDQIVYYLKKEERSGKISDWFANYLNHTVSNIKEDGCIKQYLFAEDDGIDSVKDFIQHHYPDIWQEYLDS